MSGTSPSGILARAEVPWTESREGDVYVALHPGSPLRLSGPTAAMWFFLDVPQSFDALVRRVADELGLTVVEAQPLVSLQVEALLHAGVVTLSPPPPTEGYVPPRQT